MNQIAYIEIDTHAEIAQNFMELMNDSKAFSVDYFFSEKILKNLGLKESSKIKKVTPENLASELSNKNYDLVIIGTIHRNFKVFKEITENFKTAIIVHNLNFSKISKLQLLQGIFEKDFQYRLKLLLKEDLLSATEIYRKSKNLLVLDEGFASEKYQFLPIFYTKNCSKPKNEVLRIVVPGSVSQERRDYRHILDEIKNFKTKIEIVFLGKVGGKELKWIEETQTPKNVRLIYSQEKIPTKIFDEEMQKADLLWCPVQKETEFFSQKEIYGETKMSGNIGDAIKYGKPAIFPKDFQNNHPFIFSEKVFLENQFSEIKETFEYDFSEKYSKEKVLINLEKVLRKMIVNF